MRPKQIHTPHHSIDLEKKEDSGASAVDGGGLAGEADADGPTQILISDGLPAWIGGSAAMAVAGAPLGPALAVGLVSGLALTLLSARAR